MKPCNFDSVKKYKHLFFDLDHTLWDFNSNAKAALTILFREKELGAVVQCDFEDFYQRYLHHNAVLWERYEKGFLGVEELKWKRMWRTLLDFKIGDEALAKDLSTSFPELLPVQTCVFPYTFEILEYLKNKGYILHLITNGFEKTQWSKIRNCGMHNFFTNVITSEASNSLKPKKEIFEFAVQKSGATNAESIMIGDNLKADVLGALNAGMDAVFVNHINESTGEVQPTYTITRLQDLENIF